MILLFGAGNLLVISRVRGQRARLETVRNEDDSAAFQGAIKNCLALLPDNPRDIIRLVNLMRMQFLIQRDKSQNAPLNPPFTGIGLSEQDCVAYACLHFQCPAFFAPGFVQDCLLKGKDPTEQLMDRLEELRDRRARVDQLLKALEKISWPQEQKDSLFQVSKLQRFIEVNRYLLDLDRTLEGDEEIEETEPEPEGSTPGQTPSESI